MTANEKIRLNIEPEIMEKARLNADARGQSVEDVLYAWLKRGAARASDEAWDIGSPIEAPGAAAMLMKMLEDSRGRDVP